MMIRIDAPDVAANEAYLQDLLDGDHGQRLELALDALCEAEYRARLLAETCIAEATAESVRPPEARAWLAEARAWMLEARKTVLARHALTPLTPSQASTETQETAAQ